MATFNAYPALQQQLPDWGQSLNQLQSLQFNQELQPYKIQDLQSLTAYRDLQLKRGKANMENELIGQAMREGTDAESWDAAMKRAQGLGATTASQYIGRYSDKLRQDSLAARGGMPGGGGGGGPAGQANAFAGGGMSPSQEYDFNNMPLGQVQAAAIDANRALADIDSVRRATGADGARNRWIELQLANPAYRQYGEYTPEKAQALYAQAQAQSQAINSRLMGNQMGMPAPRNVPKIEGAPGTGYVAVDPLNPQADQQVQQRQAPAPYEQLIGYDADGLPIFRDIRGQTDSKGKYPVEHGRYNTQSGAGGSMTERLIYAELERLQQEGYNVNDPMVQRMAVDRARYRQTEPQMSEPQMVSRAQQIASQSGYLPGDPEYNQIYQQSLESLRQANQAQQNINSVPPPPRGPTDNSRLPGGVPGNVPGGPPPAAVKHLRENPSLKREFDQKYGPGAADRVLGGR